MVYHLLRPFGFGDVIARAEYEVVMQHYPAVFGLFFSSDGIVEPISRQAALGRCHIYDALGHQAAVAVLEVGNVIAHEIGVGCVRSHDTPCGDHECVGFAVYERAVRVGNLVKGVIAYLVVAVDGGCHLLFCLVQICACQHDVCALIAVAVAAASGGHQADRNGEGKGDLE